MKSYTRLRVTVLHMSSFVMGLRRRVVDSDTAVHEDVVADSVRFK
jgi:hypothetical protein